MSPQIIFYLFVLFTVCACHDGLDHMARCLQSIRMKNETLNETVIVGGNWENNTGTLSCMSGNGNVTCDDSSGNVTVNCEDGSGSGFVQTNALSITVSLMVTIVAVLHF